MSLSSTSFFEELICETLYFLGITKALQMGTFEGRSHSFQVVCKDDQISFEWDFPSINGQKINVKARAHRYHTDGVGYRLSQGSIYEVGIDGLQAASGVGPENLEPQLLADLEQGCRDLVSLAALQEEKPGYWTGTW
jgi:hypothetical protein